MTPTPCMNLQTRHEYFQVIHSQSHAAQHTTHHHKRAHSKQRTTHTQKHGKNKSSYKPESLIICV